MPKHKNQRVGVFVDIQNMYYSAKQLYHAKVNFSYILNRAVAGRQLIRAIAYVIKADVKDEENFFEALEKIGYEVRSKDLQTFYGGAKKGDWDVGIAMDIMRMTSKLDVVVLVSGDGDFKDLLEHVKALGCRAEVIAFGKTASSRILSQADDFIDLDKELGKVLIREERYVKEKHQKFNKSFPKEQNFLQKLNMEQPILNENDAEKQREEKEFVFEKNEISETLEDEEKKEEILETSKKVDTNILTDKKESSLNEEKEEKKEQKKSVLKRMLGKMTRKKS